LAAAAALAFCWDLSNTPGLPWPAAQRARIAAAIRALPSSLHNADTQLNLYEEASEKAYEITS
jgi:hypothetical protein